MTSSVVAAGMTANAIRYRCDLIFLEFRTALNDQHVAKNAGDTLLAVLCFEL